MTAGLCAGHAGHPVRGAIHGPLWTLRWAGAILGDLHQGVEIERVGLRRRRIGHGMMWQCTWLAAVTLQSCLVEKVSI